MDRGALWATVHGVVKSQTQLSDEHSDFSLLPGEEKWHWGWGSQQTLVFISNILAFLLK